MNIRGKKEGYPMQTCCSNCVYKCNNRAYECSVLKGDCDPGSEFCDFTEKD